MAVPAVHLDHARLSPVGSQVVVGRARRRESRHEQFELSFGPDAHTALDLIEVTELAWHDCYGEPSLPDEVVADLLVISQGDLRALVSAVLLAVTDRRDLRVVADSRRS